MNKKQQVIQLHLQEVSQRQISEKVKISRNTVSKYIDAFEKSKATDVRNLPVTEDILSPPSYKKRTGVKRKLTSEIEERLRGFIEDNEWKRKNNMGKQQMNDHDIFMNELGEQLFAAESFSTSAEYLSLETVELTVHDLGLPEGATLSGIFKRANELGLKLCPVELGPCLRLQYLDQPGGRPSQQYQAPKGSITVASEILNSDENFPKGFYLRNIEGELWLRGYTADEGHVWAPENHFVFMKSAKVSLS